MNIALHHMCKITGNYLTLPQAARQAERPRHICKTFLHTAKSVLPAVHGTNRRKFSLKSGRSAQRCIHPHRPICTASSELQDASQGGPRDVASTPKQSRLQQAQDALRKQQQHSSSHVSLPLAKSLVETAMLAAVSGLAFTLATLLKLENYLGYFLPMPVIVAAMRSGPAAGRKTMTATCFLLLLLLGPIRAVSYVLMHGLLAVCLGALWCWRAHWRVTLLTGSLIRLLGIIGYLVVTSWTLNEDLFSLLLANVYSFLDRIAGGAGTPSPAVVVVVIACLFMVNSVLYVCVMHAVYIPLLQGMGYKTSKLPQFVQRIIARRSGQIATQ